MRIGYARTGPDDQTLALQQDALLAAGCETVITECGGSGPDCTRPALNRSLKAMKPGDTLVVTSLDRLGGSLSYLIHTIADLERRQMGFESLREEIDTTSSAGSVILHIAAALGEFERSLATERTSARIDAARRNGVKLGRKPRLTPAQITHAQTLVDAGESPRTVASTFQVGRTTLWRALKALPS